jgi:hypothetical protein
VSEILTRVEMGILLHDLAVQHEDIARDLKDIAEHDAALRAELSRADGLLEHAKDIAECNLQACMAERDESRAHVHFLEDAFAGAKQRGDALQREVDGLRQLLRRTRQCLSYRDTYGDVELMRDVDKALEVKEAPDA